MLYFKIPAAPPACSAIFIQCFLVSFLVLVGFPSHLHFLCQCVQTLFQALFPARLSNMLVRTSKFNNKYTHVTCVTATLPTTGQRTQLRTGQNTYCITVITKPSTSTSPDKKTFSLKYTHPILHQQISTVNRITTWSNFYLYSHSIGFAMYEN